MIQHSFENSFSGCAWDPVMSLTVACEAELEGNACSVEEEAPPVCRAAAA